MQSPVEDKALTQQTPRFQQTSVLLLTFPLLWVHKSPLSQLVSIQLYSMYIWDTTASVCSLHIQTYFTNTCCRSGEVKWVCRLPFEEGPSRTIAWSFSSLLLFVTLKQSQFGPCKVNFSHSCAQYTSQFHCQLTNVVF